MIEMPQTASRVESDQALYDAIISRTIKHPNHPTLNEHMRNAVANETPRGFRLAKEKTTMKIDAAVALSMAHHGALESLTPAPYSVMIDDIPLSNWKTKRKSIWEMSEYEIDRQGSKEQVRRRLLAKLRNSY